MAAAVANAPAVTLAQSTPPPAEKRAAADKGKMASGDRKFVMEALKGGMAEVELGRLATEKASNDAVKQFGQRMVDDHGKAAEELKKIAQDKGIDTPAALDGKHRKLRDRLAKLSGPEFDRAYVSEMVKDHRKDVKEFQREAEKAKDPDVKSFASKTLPTLQDHLKQVESLQTQVKSTAKAEKK
jgi:putative membrane protein